MERGEVPPVGPPPLVDTSGVWRSAKIFFFFFNFLDIFSINKCLYLLIMAFFFFVCAVLW